MSNYATDSFFLRLSAREAGETLYGCPEERTQELYREKKARLREALCLDRLDHLSCPLQVVSTGEEKLEGHVLESYDMTFLPELTVPLWALRPAKPNGKAVLLCHGHDSRGAQGSFRRQGEEDYHRYIPLYLAKEGYTVVVPELVGFGESRKEDFREEELRGCYANSTELLVHGLSMTGLRVFEALRVLDWMEGQGMERPGGYGISGGGLVISHLAAADGRMGGVVVAGFGNTFRRSILSLHHCIDNFTPGILQVGECPEILGLAAPMPMLLSNGDKDPIFPLEGTREAIAQTGEIYRRMGAGPAFQWEVFPGVHEASLERLIPFYTQTL